MTMIHKAVESIECSTVAELRLAIAKLPPHMSVQTTSPPFTGVRLVIGEGTLRIEPPKAPKRQGADEMWGD